MESTSVYWIPLFQILEERGFNGNTTASSGISFTYDFENRLLMKGAVINVYDGDGNRVSETVGSTTTKYLIDDHNPTGYTQVLDELVNGAVTRTYAYGRQRISASAKTGSSAARGSRVSTATTGSRVDPLGTYCIAELR